jgi:Phosphotransferase enzyme family
MGWAGLRHAEHRAPPDLQRVCNRLTGRYQPAPRARYSRHVLTQSDVVAYLVERALLDPDASAAAELRVRDVSGPRNRVFVIAGGGTAGYVVKQSDSPAVDLLAFELAVLGRLVEAEPRLAPYLPTPVLFDTRRGTLVCRLVGDATDLSTYHGRGRFPPLLARRLGGALALLHSVDSSALRELPATRETLKGGVPANPPSLEEVLDLSDAAVHLLRLLQGSSELCERLAALNDSRDDVAIVHGDLRPSNCVAFPRAGARRRTRIALVDWELAGRGDPHVDLGAVLGEYLHVWLWSMSAFDGSRLAQAPRYARHPLEAMQPGINAFWRGYVHNAQGRPPSLRRAVEFSAVRLVEVAFEQAQTEAALDPRAGLALQLALNVLGRPREAAVQLLGLPFAEAVR